MKIVYNACYGGFSLSREAVLLARKISGDPEWGGPCIKGDFYKAYGADPNNRKQVESDYGYIRDIERYDPVLVQVVEKLGKKASGECASLAIENVPKGSAYRIDEYDGYESVMTVDNYDWKIAE